MTSARTMQNDEPTLLGHPQLGSGVVGSAGGAWAVRRVLARLAWFSAAATSIQVSAMP